MRAGLSSRHSREYSSIIDRMRTVPPSAVRPWMKGRVEAVPDVPLFLGLRKPAPPVPLEIDRLRRKLPCRWGARSPHKSSDKSDEQTAKYRKNSHDRLTLAKICVICKSLHMTHFQSTNDGAEVVGSSDSNPVRVARQWRVIAAGEFERSSSRAKSEADRPAVDPKGEAKPNQSR